MAPAPERGIITYEVDPDFLEHAHREDLDQPRLPRGIVNQPLKCFISALTGGDHVS